MSIYLTFCYHCAFLCPHFHGIRDHHAWSTVLTCPISSEQLQIVEISCLTYVLAWNAYKRIILTERQQTANMTLLQQSLFRWLSLTSPFRVCHSVSQHEYCRRYLARPRSSTISMKTRPVAIQKRKFPCSYFNSIYCIHSSSPCSDRIKHCERGLHQSAVHLATPGVFDSSC